MIGILEAVNYLLKIGFQPKRTVYLAFGEDEEVSGIRGGAAQIAQTLKDRNVRLSFLLDEGGTIMETPSLALRSLSDWSAWQKRASFP